MGLFTEHPLARLLAVAPHATHFTMILAVGEGTRVRPVAEVEKYGVVETAPDSRILRFQEKPKREEAVSSTINTGIYLFEPAVLDWIPGGVPFDIGSQLFPLPVEQALPFYGVSLLFTWRGSTLAARCRATVSRRKMVPEKMGS